MSACKYLLDLDITECDVTKLACHSNFSTTHKYYLAVRDDLIEKAKLATTRGLCKKLMNFGSSIEVGWVGVGITTHTPQNCPGLNIT